MAGPIAGKVSDVQKNDNASFLPANAESTKALELDKAFAGSETIPAIVVWERASGLTAADRAAIDAAARKIGGIDGLSGPPSPVIPSKDGAAAQLVVPLPGAHGFDGAGPIVAEIRVDAAEVPAGVSSHVTGPGGFIADLSKAFEGIDGQLLVVTGLVVLVILLVVYRSPVFVPVLLSAGLALTTAQAAAYQLAKNDVITLNGQSAGHPARPGVRCRHRLRAAAHQPVPRGAARPRAVLGRHAGGLAGHRRARHRVGVDTS